MPDLSKRLAEPGDDDQLIRAFEMEFGMPCYITAAQQRKLRDIFDEIIESPANQPVDGVHWLAGCGSKPHFSVADSAFLGKPVEPAAPETGEPTFDNSVLYFESCARGFVSDRERVRKEKQRKKA